MPLAGAFLSCFPLFTFDIGSTVKHRASENTFRKRNKAMLDAVQVAASTQAPGRQISGCDTAIGNHGRDLPAAGRSHRPAMAAAGRDRGAGDPRTDDQKISFVHARPVLRYARDLWLRDRITQSLIFLFSQISFYKQQFIELYRPADAESSDDRVKAGVRGANHFRSHGNADSEFGAEQRRRGGRRSSVLGRLFVPVRNLDQHSLGPGSAEKFDAHGYAERRGRSL